MKAMVEEIEKTNFNKKRKYTELINTVLFTKPETAWTRENPLSQK